VLWLVAYAVPILDPGFGRGMRAACDTVDVLTWAAFGLDYLARLTVGGRDCWRVPLRHPFGLLLLVLPFLQPLRLLRVVLALVALHRRAGARLRRRVGAFVASSTVLVAFFASCEVLSAERGVASASIQGFGDAFWWTAATMSTVGYGDYAPVTTTGRVVGVCLMLYGIAFIGVVSASVATLFLDQEHESAGDAAEAERGDLLALAEEVRRLREELAAHGAVQPAEPPRAEAPVGDAPRE